MRTPLLVLCALSLLSLASSAIIVAKLESLHPDSNALGGMSVALIRRNNPHEQVINPEWKDNKIVFPGLQEKVNADHPYIFIMGHGSSLQMVLDIKIQGMTVTGPQLADALINNGLEKIMAKLKGKTLTIFMVSCLTGQPYALEDKTTMLTSIKDFRDDFSKKYAALPDPKIAQKAFMRQQGMNYETFEPMFTNLAGELFAELVKKKITNVKVMGPKGRVTPDIQDMSSPFPFIVRNDEGPHVKENTQAVQLAAWTAALDTDAPRGFFQHVIQGYIDECGLTDEEKNDPTRKYLWGYRCFGTSLLESFMDKAEHHARKVAKSPAPAPKKAHGPTLTNPVTLYSSLVLSDEIMVLYYKALARTIKERKMNFGKDDAFFVYADGAKGTVRPASAPADTAHARPKPAGAKVPTLQKAASLPASARMRNVKKP